MKQKKIINTVFAMFAIPALLSLSGFWTDWNDIASPPPEVIARGKVVFHNVCSPCHGKDGKGNGIIASNLAVKPRDLTRGVYKNRSTATGTLPTTHDLYQTLTNGVHSTSMPSYRSMKPEDRWAVVEYIKTLSQRFSDPDEYPLEVLHPRDAPQPTLDNIAKGAKIYATMKCGDCHGATGKADIDSAAKQVDDLGRPVKVPDLTHPAFYKFSRNPSDVFRILSTGLDGVPMPSYLSTIGEEERWYLAYYIWSMQNGYWYFNIAYDTLLKKP